MPFPSGGGVVTCWEDTLVCLFVQLDYMLLGLLVYEMATGKRPFEDIYPLSTVVLALLHNKVELNVEADHFLQKQGQQVCVS